MERKVLVSLLTSSPVQDQPIEQEIERRVWSCYARFIYVCLKVIGIASL